jgi:transposase
MAPIVSIERTSKMHSAGRYSPYQYHPYPTQSLAPQGARLRALTVEVITSVQRRRRWSRAEKEGLVAAALEPGAVASEVARAAGIHTSQLFRWRQQLCEQVQSPVAFNPVAIAAEPGTVTLPSPRPMPEQAGTVEIEFATGGRMRITGSVDASTVSALTKALAKIKRRR